MSDEQTEDSTNRIRKLEDNNSFTFKVEKNKRPGKKLRQMSPEDICDNFFKGENSSWEKEKIFEVLFYSFESGDSRFSPAGDSSVIEGYRMAYLKHFPIVLSPNIFWLMILQGFSRHMEINENSKRLRHKFVDFEGQKKIYIESGITNLFMASDEQWNLIIERLLNETLKNIKIDKTILDKFNKKFSTTTSEAEIANNVTILSSFKKYFIYSINGTCGIPEITIEGTIEDWKLLHEKIIELGNLDEEIVFWTDELKKIIKKIIDTLETKQPDINFYKNIVQNTDKSKECKQDLVNGSIIKFIPYDKDNKKCEFNSPDFDGLNIDQIPTQIVNLPFHLKTINKNNNIQECECEIYTGFFGVKQDGETLSIKPIIGYAIVKVKNREQLEKEKLEEQIRISIAMRQFETMNFNQ